MSLPPRAAAIYVALSNTDASTYYPPGAEGRQDGTIMDDFQSTGATRAEEQKDFYSYQSWFTKYPNELIVKVHQGLLDAGLPDRNQIRIGVYNPFDLTYKCPTNYVVNYNPGPPDYDPVPDPNGETANLTDTVVSSFAPIAPRWDTDTPFDYSDDTDSPSSYDFFSNLGVVPKKGRVYYLYPSNFREINDFVGSWDIQVVNLLSEVLNVQTGDYEYYPFEQLTTEFKATAKFTIPKDWTLCCWNTGTVIRGKVAIYSADVTTSTIPETGYGFAGMKAVIGDEFSPHSEVDWEVTLEDGYTPVEIELPKVAGKVTFVNDFWVTEVVPPGG